jgi:RNA-binding protein Tab2/Atab2
MLNQPGAVRPEKCRFFRGQMQTIISKALNEMDIKPLPSRRCFALMCKRVGPSLYIGLLLTAWKESFASGARRGCVQARRAVQQQGTNPVHLGSWLPTGTSLCLFGPTLALRCAMLSQPTPDALRGEQWAFVQLPLGVLEEMVKDAETVTSQCCA